LTHDAGVAIAVAVRGGRAGKGRPDVPEGLRLPDRPDDGNKGTFGHVLVVAGARGYTGAPQLAALGAARGGAGLVTVCVPEAIYAIVAAPRRGRRCAPRRGAGNPAPAAAHRRHARHRPRSGQITRDRGSAARSAA